MRMTCGSCPAPFAREKMDVLADAAQVRVVVLGYQRDPERPRVLNVRHRE